MKTIKICYPLHPYYCPNCKAVYFSEVECNCPNQQKQVKQVPCGDVITDNSSESKTSPDNVDDHNGFEEGREFERQKISETIKTWFENLESSAMESEVGNILWDNETWGKEKQKIFDSIVSDCNQDREFYRLLSTSEDLDGDIK